MAPGINEALSAVPENFTTSRTNASAINFKYLTDNKSSHLARALLILVADPRGQTTSSGRSDPALQE
jgi:hypothetical protein